MSADNGYIIRQRDDGKFTLQMYFASADDYPPIEKAEETEVFDTLEAAVLKYAEMSKANPYLSEYGLSVETPLIHPEFHVYGLLTIDEKGRAKLEEL